MRACVEEQAGLELLRESPGWTYFSGARDWLQRSAQYMASAHCSYIEDGATITVVGGESHINTQKGCDGGGRGVIQRNRENISYACTIRALGEIQYLKQNQEMCRVSWKWCHLKQKISCRMLCCRFSHNQWYMVHQNSAHCVPKQARGISHPHKHSGGSTWIHKVTSHTSPPKWGGQAEGSSEESIWYGKGKWREWFMWKEGFAKRWKLLTTTKEELNCTAVGERGEFLSL